MARGGKIQIDFMAKATDKVSATMKKVNSSVKGTGKEAGAAAGKMGKLNVAMAAIAAAANMSTPLRAIGSAPCNSCSRP